MIINHQHKFCFFAIPRTGSKAVSSVLVNQLASEEILKMHTSYDEFMEVAKGEERTYFTFATVRNPLDSVVSAYFKKKNDHNGRFSRGTFGNGRPIGEKAMEEYKFISKQEASFSEYFIRFYTDVYTVPRHEATLEKVKVVLRYERLSEDFSNLLKDLRLPDYSIPLVNRTNGKEGGFQDYYTPEIIDRAKMVFGPFMRKWAYSFPNAWDS